MCDVCTQADNTFLGLHNCDIRSFSLVMCPVSFIDDLCLILLNDYADWCFSGSILDAIIWIWKGIMTTLSVNVSVTRPLNFLTFVSCEAAPGPRSSFLALQHVIYCSTYSKRVLNESSAVNHPCVSSLPWSTAVYCINSRAIYVSLCLHPVFPSASRDVLWLSCPQVGSTSSLVCWMHFHYSEFSLMLLQQYSPCIGFFSAQRNIKMNGNCSLLSQQLSPWCPGARH